MGIKKVDGFVFADTPPAVRSSQTPVTPCRYSRECYICYISCPSHAHVQGHEATVVPSTSPTTPSSPSVAVVLNLFLSILASFLAFHLAALSSSLMTGGLSSILGPQGATISVTTCWMCRLMRLSRTILTTSPAQREELGSETR